MDIYLAIIGFSALISLIGFFWLVITGFRRSAFWGVLIFLFWPLTAFIFSALNWFDAKKPFLVFILSMILMFGTMGYMVSEIGINNLTEMSRRVQAGELKSHEVLTLMDKALISHESVDLFKPVKPEEPEPDVVASEETSESNTATIDAGKKEEQGQLPAKDNKSVANETGHTDKPDTGKSKKDEKKKPESVATEENKNPDEIIDKIPSPEYPKLSEVRPDPLIAKRKLRDADFVIVKFKNAKNYQDRYFVIYTKKQTFLRGLLVKADKSALYLDRKLFGGSFKYRLSKKKIKTIYVMKKKFVAERDKNRLPGF